jgi:hypothetical protein
VVTGEKRFAFERFLQELFYVVTYFCSVTRDVPLMWYLLFIRIRYPLTRILAAIIKADSIYNSTYYRCTSRATYN